MLHMPGPFTSSRRGASALLGTVLILSVGLTACGSSTSASTSDSAADKTETAEASTTSSDAAAPTTTPKPGQAVSQPMTAQGQTYSVTVTKVTDPADASAPWGGGGTGEHFVALDLELTQTDAQAPAAAVNGSCFTATDSDGNAATIKPGYVTEGAKAIEGTMTSGQAPVQGQLVVQVPPGKHLKSVTAACDGRSQDTAVVTLP